MNRGFSFLGWAALVLVHLYRLRDFPGLHYDEAWAYNFAARIGPGFRPLSAMSPYTSPWTHYWAAFCLRCLGPGLVVFRGSQIALALGGLVALCFALPKHIRVAFPWACLLLPGAVLNHRFAVELTGFHVLCFGVLCWSLRRERWWIATVFALLGTTAHIMFYAVALGLLGTVCLEGLVLPRRARLGAMVYFAVMAAFFARVLFLIPEKGKAAALVASAMGAFGLLAAKGERLGWWIKLRTLVALTGFAFFWNCAFFAAGIWTLTLYLGFPDFWEKPFVGILVLVVAVAAASVAVAKAPLVLRRWLWLSLAFAGLMMLKPAPRYFELEILGLIASATYLVSDEVFYGRRWGNRVVCTVALISSIAQLRLIATGPPTSDTTQHFLFYKDASRDFLDKQKLVRFLGGSGCRRDDIETHDPRLKEELDALSLGDWPVEAKTCPYVYVARATEDGAAGDPYDAFLLKRK